MRERSFTAGDALTDSISFVNATTGGSFRNPSLMARCVSRRRASKDLACCRKDNWACFVGGTTAPDDDAASGDIGCPDGDAAALILPLSPVFERNFGKDYEILLQRVINGSQNTCNHLSYRKHTHEARHQSLKTNLALYIFLRANSAVKSS